MNSMKHNPKKSIRNKVSASIARIGIENCEHAANACLMWGFFEVELPASVIFGKEKEPFEV